MRSLAIDTETFQGKRLCHSPHIAEHPPGVHISIRGRGCRADIRGRVSRDRWPLAIDCSGRGVTMLGNVCSPLGVGRTAISAELATLDDGRVDKIGGNLGFTETVANVGNRGMIYTKSLGQGFNFVTACADCGYGLVRERSDPRKRLSTWGEAGQHATLGDGVIAIVRRRSQKMVIILHAYSVVAHVAHVLPRRDRPVSKRVHGAVHKPRIALDTDLAVAAGLKRARPFETPDGLIGPGRAPGGAGGE